MVRVVANSVLINIIVTFFPVNALNQYYHFSLLLIMAKITQHLCVAVFNYNMNTKSVT